MVQNSWIYHGRTFYRPNLYVLLRFPGFLDVLTFYRVSVLLISSSHKMDYRHLLILGAVFSFYGPGCILTEVREMRPCEPGISDHLTSGCCSVCPSGTGVVESCSEGRDTLCSPCDDGSTFSSTQSHVEKCKNCKVCDGNANVVSPCTSTNDTVCECRTGYYMDKYEKICKQCDLCPEGFGIAKRCTPTHNTRCKKCPQGSFSDTRDSKGCRYCSVCLPDQLTLHVCNYREDTVCVAMPVPVTSSDLQSSNAEATNNGSKTSHGDIIPVYCSLLGALILGLIIYVIIAHRRRQAANKLNRTGVHEGASPTSKQGSDSGVFVEQDQKQALLAKKFLDLSPSTIRVVEGMLMTGGNNVSDWRHLASKLGYNTSQTANIEIKARQEGQSPSHCLLADWGATENATCGELVKALRTIARDDIARLLQPDNRDAHRNRDAIEPLVV